MTCEELLRLLDEDAALSSEATRGHAESCASCAAELARARAVRDGLRALGEESAPPFLHARIMAHVRASRAERRPAFSVLRLAWAGPLLVLACLGALGGWGLWRALAPGGSADLAPALPGPAVATAPTLAAPRASDQSLARQEAARRDKGHERVAAVAPAAPARTAPARRRALAGAPTGLHEKELRTAPAAPPAGQFAPEPVAVAGERRAELALEARGEDAATGALGGVPLEPAGRPAAGAGAARADAARGGAPMALGKAAPAPRAFAVGREAARAPAGPLDCLLVSTATGGVTRLRLPAALAPGPGARWLVTVNMGGAVAVREQPAAPPRRDAAELLERLHLRPGTYHLTRAGG